MKILIRLCFVCLFTTIGWSNAQAQMETEMTPINDRCWYMEVTFPTSVDMITIQGVEGGDFIMAKNTTTCEGTICFNGLNPVAGGFGGGSFGGSSPGPAPGTDVYINCSIWKNGEVIDFDGCTVTIGPG